MTKVHFGSLADVKLRTAWEDEARDFTPWLADNLDRLGEAVGLQLEVLATEAGLPTDDDRFSADILARNLFDETNVLIENQLERSDHGHLGQILTYLAGLEAKTIIWIAPRFRDSHLAAIKWLNENTREEFSFFAVQVRLVQIENSPFAPMFNILEKPNRWERRLQTRTREKTEPGALAVKRRVFWEHFQKAYPVYVNDGTAGGASSMWRYCCDGELVISYYLAQKNVGLFVRGRRNISADEVQDNLLPYQAILEDRLGVPFGPTPSGYFLSQTHQGDFSEITQFDDLSLWLDQSIQQYETVLNSLLQDKS